MSAQNLMIMGTASNVGKTSITSALCHWIHTQGVSVIPFKTMSVGGCSFQTSSGGEIHIHQAQQAIAANLDPQVDMNPIMFKSSGKQLQILVSGTASEDILRLPVEGRFEDIRSVITETYRQIEKQYDFVVLEGCGSPVELNIKERDLANFWAAEAFDAPCLLVASIENVGVFASILGTLSLLSKSERSRIIGFVINKFHGDPELFLDGVSILEEKTNLPCLGVIPYLDGLKYVGKDPEITFSDTQMTVQGFPDDFGEELKDWNEHAIAHLDTKTLESLIF